MIHPLRAIAYLWALPNSAIGLPLAIATLATGGRARRHTGVLEVWGGFARYFLTHLVPLPGGAAAMTLGHIILARDADCHTRTRAHERIHVRQCERWGPFFIPAYLLTALLLKLRGKDAYLDNPFEREAFANS